MKKTLQFDTRAAKSYLDGRKEHRPLNHPIIQSTTFQAVDSRRLGRMFRNRSDGVYQRFGHPTAAAAASKVAELEGAEAGLAFSSGMGAITTAVLAALRPDRHVVAQRQIFDQTFTFLDRTARPLAAGIDFVEATDLEAVAAAIRPDTGLVYVETPSNPLLQVCDVAAIARLCRQRDILLFVDSTFASPYAQNPLALGANLVLHSGTKFLGGHSDVMCGFAAGDAALIGRIRDVQVLLGNVLDPHAAWLVLRGIKTLALRVQRQSDNALHIARFLESCNGVRAVHYPFLGSSPHFEVARRQMRCGGGVVSFEVDGGQSGARAFLDALELIPVATSLGGVETIVEIPHDLDFGPDQPGGCAGGISPGLIRLSVGIENAEDLIRDLRRGALALHAPSRDLPAFLHTA